jgi:hypothetical protein
LDLGDRSSSYCVLNEAGEIVLEQKQLRWETASGLSAELREALEPLMQEIESLNERIQEYDRRIEKMAKATYPEVALLKQLWLISQLRTGRFPPRNYLVAGSSWTTLRQNRIRGSIMRLAFPSGMKLQRHLWAALALSLLVLQTALILIAPRASLGISISNSVNAVLLVLAASVATADADDGIGGVLNTELQPPVSAKGRSYQLLCHLEACKGQEKLLGPSIFENQAVHEFEFSVRHRGYTRERILSALYLRQSNS